MKSTRNPPRSSHAPQTLLALALLAGCAAPIAGMEKEVRPADLDALKETGTKAGGLVVWTSSRAGLPHVFSMKTDGTDIKQLTKGPHTDWRPRFSPDGARILFQRSVAKDFVRESDANAPDAWDLYTVGVDGSGLKKVVENASWGSWAGPDAVVFVRGSKVMRAKLDGEGEPETKTLVDTARYGFFDGSVIQQPELSRDGHFVALTLAGRHRQVGIWSIKKKHWTELGQGTQISWAPDGASVIWTDASGKDQSRIAREPVVAGVAADERDPDKLLLVDLPGKRSRERFPSLSNDGKWLVFAAAINDSENDLEDYELFLYEAGAPATNATRLTFHSSNDRWPDVFIAAAGGTPAAPEGGSAEGNAAEKTDKDDEKAAATEKAEETHKAEPARETEGEKAEPGEAEKESAPAAASEDAPDEAAPPPAKAKKKKRRR